MVTDFGVAKAQSVSTVAIERSVRDREPMLMSVYLGCDQMLDPLKLRPRCLALPKEFGIDACPVTENAPVLQRPR